MILLDTCTFLWLASHSPLPPFVIESLKKNAGGIFLSTISVLEIGTKIRKRKIELSLPLCEWYPKAIENHGIHEIPLTSDIALLASELPPIHFDPADRIILATAQKNSLMLLTPDEMIRQYHQVNVRWAAA